MASAELGYKLPQDFADLLIELCEANAEGIDSWVRGAQRPTCSASPSKRFRFGLPICDRHKRRVAGCVPRNNSLGFTRPRMRRTNQSHIVRSDELVL